MDTSVNCEVRRISDLTMIFGIWAVNSNSDSGIDICACFHCCCFT